MVAVTHDNELAFVLTEADDKVPKYRELISRISTKFTPDIACGGACLQINESSQDKRTDRPSPIRLESPSAWDSTLGANCLKGNPDLWRMQVEDSPMPDYADSTGKSEEAERRRSFDEAAVAPWVTAMATAPVGFPYKLPAPAPPSTPRMTRHQMLRNEMSESLRHNLLWQRKLSRTDLIGPLSRRTKSTAEKSLVGVTLRAPGAERREGTLPPMDPPLVDGVANKRVRNLSWADASDYHRTGW
ncbi:hypothetical protein DFH09DRAFT_1467228 [Mycena vulgaris]|nr:hypothetical protein DFH09DRAFT_1467228 [Mycena vulgaris]